MLLDDFYFNQASSSSAGTRVGGNFDILASLMSLAPDIGPCVTSAVTRR